MLIPRSSARKMTRGTTRGVGLAMVTESQMNEAK